MAIPDNFNLFKSGVLAPNSGDECQKYFYDFKTQLVAAGWTVEASGDGAAAYGAASDVLTVRGKGANGINNGAWFRGSNPDGREICIQAVQGFVNDGVSAGCRSKYSGADGFTGGAPSATQVPSATDEGLWAGGGTDAAPTATTGGFIWGGESNGTFNAVRSLYFGLFETVSPYRFLYAMQKDAYASTIGGWHMDVVEAPAFGSHTDPDPVALYQAGRITSTAAAWGIRALDDMHRINVAYAPSGAGAHAMIDGALLPFACIPYGGNNLLFNQNSDDEFAGGTVLAPAMWARYPDGIAGGKNGIKGMASLFGYHPYPHDSIGWQTNRLYSFDGSPFEYIMLNNAVMPWDGTDPYAGTGWVSAIGSSSIKLFNFPSTLNKAICGGADPVVVNPPVLSSLPGDQGGIPLAARGDVGRFD